MKNMKKLLAVLGLVAIAAPATLSVVACGPSIVIKKATNVKKANELFINEVKGLDGIDIEDDINLEEFNNKIEGIWNNILKTINVESDKIDLSFDTQYESKKITIIYTISDEEESIENQEIVLNCIAELIDVIDKVKNALGENGEKTDAYIEAYKEYYKYMQGFIEKQTKETPLKITSITSISIFSIEIINAIKKVRKSHYLLGLPVEAINPTWDGNSFKFDEKNSIVTIRMTLLFNNNNAKYVINNAKIYYKLVS